MGRGRSGSRPGAGAAVYPAQPQVYAAPAPAMMYPTMMSMGPQVGPQMPYPQPYMPYPAPQPAQPQLPAPMPMAAYLPREDPNEKSFSISVQVLIFLFSLAAFLVAVLLAGGYIKVNLSSGDCANLGYTKCKFYVFWFWFGPNQVYTLRVTLSS